MSHGHAKKKSVKSGYMMSSKKKIKSKKQINSLLDLNIGNKTMESVDLDAKNVEIMLIHDCPSHVNHGEFG